MTGKLIYEVLPKIIGEVAPISKERHNKQQGYAFRGVDDVYSALNLLLAKHGVSIIPSMVEQSEIVTDSKSGGKLFRVKLTVDFHISASDGSEVVARVPGEAMDSGDKATPKALSVAYKYMAFQVFCIPTGEKIDVEYDSPEPAQKNGNGKPSASEQSVALTEEYRQALEACKDADSLTKVGLKISAAHEAGRILEKQRAELKDVYKKQVATLGARA
jgi:hypothetical protein